MFEITKIMKQNFQKMLTPNEELVQPVENIKY